MSQFNFNLIDLTHNEVIESLKESLKGKEVVNAVKMYNDGEFYITIVIPCNIWEVRMIDIVNKGDYDFEVKISEPYDIRSIDGWFTNNDKDIVELERLQAFDAVKHICRNWDNL